MQECDTEVLTTKAPEVGGPLSHKLSPSWIDCDPQSNDFGLSQAALLSCIASSLNPDKHDNYMLCETSPNNI
jgi:hypothetical protein